MSPTCEFTNNEVFLDLGCHVPRPKLDNLLMKNANAKIFNCREAGGGLFILFEYGREAVIALNGRKFNGYTIRAGEAVKLRGRID